MTLAVQHSGKNKILKTAKIFVYWVLRARTKMAKYGTKSLFYMSVCMCVSYVCALVSVYTIRQECGSEDNI